MSDDRQLAYIGKVVMLDPIPEADSIVSATVVCGGGGKWRGVVKKSDFSVGSKCVVYLPDALLPETEEFAFMKSRGYRVRMCRFRGAPSEVLIMPAGSGANKGLEPLCRCSVGLDVTQRMQVRKYHKPVPANLQGVAIGDFPSFMPKTDELNYQRHYDLVEKLHGSPYYVTEKADGSSTTAFCYKGKFGVCSRNYELAKDEKNGYWEVAMRYGLDTLLPEGIALQWETCGPKIQGNPMGFSKVDGLAFSAYDIPNHRYLEMRDLVDLCNRLSFPMVPVVEQGEAFDKENVDKLGEGKYKNGREREGVVVRSRDNDGHHPISFKVINLSYEK